MQDTGSGPPRVRRHRRPSIGVALVLTLLAGVVTIVPSDDRADALPGGFTNTAVISGLVNPTALAFSPDGKVYVAEKGGYVHVYPSIASNEGAIFADLSRHVFNNWDRGLLGLAVDPRLGDGTGHDFVYVLYAKDAVPGGTAPRWNDRCPNPPGGETDGCVVTGTLSRIPVRPDGSAGTEQVLIDEQWCQQYTSHSVGALRFGPDGYLYVSGGEGASWANADWGQFGGSLPDSPTLVNPCDDPPGRVGVANTSPTGRGGALRSQSPRRPSGEPRLLNGSVLRVDPDTGHGVPGNPMYSAAAPSSNESRILAYGMRNPFRFTHRPGSDEVWVGDVGQSTWEEINVIPSTTPDRAPNFGWPCLEGPDQRGGYNTLDMCRDLYRDAADPATQPWFRYEHDERINGRDTCGAGNGSSISGLAFYGGGGYPASYRDSLFVADTSRSCIWVMSAGADGEPDPASAQTFLDSSEGAFPVGLEIEPTSGDLFYVDLVAGTVNRISYSSTNRAPVAVASASPTSGTAPLTVQLDGRASSDPDGDTLTYSWDIDGNGTFGDRTGATVSVTYDTAATFTPRLMVTDPGGRSSTATTASISVTGGGPRNTAAPTVSGTARIGSSLASTTGVWTGATPMTHARQWQRCTSATGTSCVDIAGATGTSYAVQLADADAHLRVRVTATNSGGSTSATSSTVGPVLAGANTPPAPYISAPATSLRWVAGDRIAFAGGALDTQDGAVPAARLSWRIVTGHCNAPTDCHEHELDVSQVGVASGHFFAEEHLAPSFIEITLTATDSVGATASTTRRIDPVAVDLTAATSPAGLSVTAGDQQGPAPLRQSWVANSQVQLDAPTQQTVGGKVHYFTGWSHGGTRQQIVRAPRVDTTYTATYGVGPGPVGRYETLRLTEPGRIRVTGWSVDPDVMGRATAIDVSVGGPPGTPGAQQYRTTAHRSRPDVAALHPSYGAGHGFDLIVTTQKRGRQQVCIRVVNVGAGSDTSLGCRSVVIADPNPTGHFQRVSSPGPGLVWVRGWAIDPSAPLSAVKVQVVVGGPRGTPGTESFLMWANRHRPDVARPRPGTGSHHGFEAAVATELTGEQQVCVYALNLGVGSDRWLGCSTVDIVK